MKDSENRDVTSRTMRWSIKWKLMTLITALVLSLVAILSYAQISSQKRILEQELENRVALMKANLIERGKGFAISLSQQVENDLAGMNLSGVMEAILQSTEENNEIKYAILMKSNGRGFSPYNQKRIDKNQA